MNKKQILNELNHFEDAEEIRQHGNDYDFLHENYSGMEYKEMRRLLFEYIKLVHKILNQ